MTAAHDVEMVAAYVRVSSRTQDDAMQRAAITRAAGARGDEIGVWYAESRSARTLARPELDRLRGDARAGHLRRLYLFRLDRLTRSGIRDTLEVVDELRRHGVEIRTVSDGFDLDGPAAEVVLAVMAWASKMERLAINERISAARDRMEREGRGWGRPRRLDDATIERARAMRAEGRTLRELAVALKVPRATVGRALLGTTGEAGSDPRE
ncbi:MAG: recombinase family protein [Deltaproteobacteria bacterium]|nr:recombinase family protein [Deltaproteobacteria bacterium]